RVVGCGATNDFSNTKGFVEAVGPLLNGVLHSLLLLGVSVDDVLRELLFLIDVGLGENRLNQDGANAKGPDFVVQRLRVTFEAVLARAVDAVKRRGKETECRADVHDTPAALSAHSRKNSLGYTQHSEEICVELLLRLFNTGLFQGSGQPVASIIN